MTSTTPTGVEIRAIRPQELTAWAAITPAPERALRRLADDPQADLQGMLVAVDGQERIACCRVLHRTMYLSGRRLKLGIVDELHLRREGFPVRALLDAALAYMRDQGVPIAFWPRAEKAAAPFGWQALSFGWSRICFAATEEDVRALREEDMARVRGLYGLWAGAVDGLLVREHPEHWDKWIRVGWKNPCVLCENGQAVAYADWEDRDGERILRDWAQLPGRDDLLPRFMGRLAAGREMLVPTALLAGAKADVYAQHCMAQLLFPVNRGEIHLSDTQELAEALSGAAFLPSELR